MTENNTNNLHLSSPFGGQGTALIFAAGLGTRFKPWTDSHPKALAVINGKSLLQRNVEYLQKYGIRNVVVNVHHFADQIIQAIDQANGWGSHITISDETDAVLETGGGLLKAKALLGNQPFFTLNADILTDADLHAMKNRHRERGALVTLGVTDRVSSRYLLFDKNSRLCGWRNTGTGAERLPVACTEYIPKAYSGLALFQPTVFDYITQSGKFSLIDVFLSLAPQHQLVAFDHSHSKVLDVGKPESVALAEKMFP